MNYKKILKVVGVVAVSVVFCIGCEGYSDGGDFLADPNDGNGDNSYTYSGRTVKIGNQTWMAENLDRATTNSKCYENSADSCAKYGRLYTWTDAKKACPSGWHLPTIAEWTTLLDYAGGGDKAGTKLKSTSGWYDDAFGGNGTDDYGFTALPSGNCEDGGNFNNIGKDGNWWSATKSDIIYRYDDAEFTVGNGLNMNYRNESVLSFSCPRCLYSVRCVQD
jgi:uncharacterized protein (TIGR02145 family)